MAVHLPSNITPKHIHRWDLSRANLRRSEGPVYRCFLPDLTGFTGFRRVGPSSQYQHPGKEVSEAGPPGGIQPR